MKMGPTASENVAADEGHQVPQYKLTIVAYTQIFLDMEDLFGTSANWTVGI